MDEVYSGIGQSEQVTGLKKHLKPREYGKERYEILPWITRNPKFFFIITVTSYARMETDKKHYWGPCEHSLQQNTKTNSVGV